MGPLPVGFVEAAPSQTGATCKVNRLLPWILLASERYFLWPVVHDVSDVCRLVPARYRWLATALVLTDGHARHAPPALRGYWRGPVRQAADIQNETHTDAMIEDITNFVAAAVLAIDGYLSGHLDVREEGRGGAGKATRRSMRPGAQAHRLFGQAWHGQEHNLALERRSWCHCPRHGWPLACRVDTFAATFQSHKPEQEALYAI